MKGNVILIIILIFILIAIGLGFIGIKYIKPEETNNISENQTQENNNINEKNDTSKNNNTTNNESKKDDTDSIEKNVIEQAQYIQIKVEKKGTLDYEKEIKIEDKTVINELEKIINQSQEYIPTSKDAMGFDVAPSITFYLKDKAQISVVAIDDCSVASGEKMNLAIVRKNNEDNSKKVYSLKQPLGQKVRELYEKFK